MKKKYIYVDESLEALLYDWHNHLKLKSQNQDIKYFINFISKNKFRDVLIVGAGTGRIAMPLSGICNITALDKSYGRLKRISVNSNINVICNDIVDYGGNKSYDCIIIPYSTFQCIYPTKKILKMLSVIHDHLSDYGFLVIDVSTHFNDNGNQDWTKVTEGFSCELNAEIKEYNKTVRFRDHILLKKRFEIDDKCYYCEEVWYNYDYDYMHNVLFDTGFTITNISNGYGGEKSIHRRLFFCRLSND